MNDYVYVPTYQNGNCVYIYSSDIIRVYDSVPQNNRTISYKDYYIKSDYIYNTGSTSFNQYSTLPTCIASERITTDFYYRNDLPSILFIFLVFAFVCFWIPWKLITIMFRRWH